MTGRSYKRERPEGPWDAIVIGSGMGGLSTAALLARNAWKRVLVLERHYTAGGFTHVFKRREYEWDVGIHYVGGIEGNEVGPLFDVVTGGKVTWARMPDCYDRIFIDERPYDLVSGPKKFVDTLSESFPGQRDAISQYLKTVRRSTMTGAPYFADRMLSPRTSKLLGPALRAPFRHYSNRTTEEVVRPLIKDRTLFDVLTGQCGDYGLIPSESSFAVHAMVASHYLGGGYYPVGGCATIAAATERVIGAAGGEIYTNAEVAEILLEGGRAVGVKMSDGEEIRAPMVASNVGIAGTLTRLLPRDAAQRTGLLEGVREVGPSIAHLCLYLGFKKTDEELGLTGTNLWVYAPGDREEAFRRFAEDPEAPLPVTYLSFPSAKDPSFASRYPGRATVEIITLAKMEWFQRWAETRWMNRGEEYEAFKQRLTERMLEKLFEQRPQLRGQVDHAELSTPLSTKHFTGHEHGEMYGLAHTPARYRLPLHAQMEIPGLYLTGSDLVSCGVAGALFGGALCAGAMLKKELPDRFRRSVFGGLPRKRGRRRRPKIHVAPSSQPRP